MTVRGRKTSRRGRRLFPQIKSIVDGLDFVSSDIMTSWEDVRKVPPSPNVVPDALSVAIESDRYIPVADAGDRILGIVQVPSRDFLAEEEAGITFLGPRDPLVDTVSEICDRYIEGKPTMVFVGRQGDLRGLIDHSDLNKSDVSVMLYAAFSEFEARLSSLISGYAKDDWWLDLIGNDHRAELRKKYEAEVANGVDVDLMHCAYLSDKIRITSRSGGLRRKLGYERQKDAKDELGSLEMWRNRVSHRSGEEDLLHDWKELAKLSRVLKRVDRWLDLLGGP